MTYPNMKDITFEIKSLYNGESEVKLFYGQKCIANTTVNDSHITRMKLVALAVQGEIMKDIINKTP
jgi:hypothetical protein